jgi:hypothetical protein
MKASWHTTESRFWKSGMLDTQKWIKFFIGEIFKYGSIWLRWTMWPLGLCSLICDTPSHLHILLHHCDEYEICVAVILMYFS